MGMVLSRRAFVIGTLARATEASGNALPPRSTVRRIGVILTFAKDDPEARRRVEAFSGELAERGWREGDNLQIDYRFAAGNPEELTRSAREVIRSEVQVLVSNSYQRLQDVLAEARALPIIFAMVPDPVRVGLLKSVSRPDANITGFMTFEFSIIGKWLELLKRAVPRISSAGLIFNPNAYSQTLQNWSIWQAEFDASCRALGLEPIACDVRSVEGLRSAITSLPADSGLLIAPDSFTVGHYRRVVAAALERKLPACFPYRYFTTEGGLMSYGPNGVHMFRQAAAYADRILRGARASELPVQRPANFELVLNLRSARALNIELAQALLIRADEVIE
jgi:putative ABC transport system substrate-binding protein